jgi:hypothetical protein
MLIDNQLTGNERELGRFFVVLGEKGDLNGRNLEQKRAGAEETTGKKGEAGKEAGTKTEQKPSELDRDAGLC